MNEQKLTPCTIGPKHKWDYANNVIVKRVTDRGFSLEVKGRYRCACGARKLGPMRHEEAAPGAQEGA